MTRTDDHGFLITPQWARVMEVEISLANRRVRKLENAGLVRRLRSPLLTVSPIVLTQMGCDLIGSGLPPLSRVRLSQFEHDTTLIDLSLHLLKRFGPNAKWISERWLQQMHPNSEHTADGILQREGAGDVAVEVELTCKNRNRLEAILAAHVANFQISEVWYFTNNAAVATLVRRLSEGYPQVKVITFSRGKSLG